MHAETSTFPRWRTQESRLLTTVFVAVSLLLGAIVLSALAAAAVRDQRATLPLPASLEPADGPQPSNSPRSESFALGSNSQRGSKIPFMTSNGRSHIKLDFIPLNERTSRTRMGFPTVTAPKGAYGIEGHGTPDSVFCRTGEPMSARELAKWIRNDSRYHQGMPVYLMCCETGKGSRPFGQKLADELGGEVMAPTEKLWPLKTGLYIVAREKTHKSLGMFDVGTQRADITSLGAMKSFRPGLRVESTTDSRLAMQSPPTRIPQSTTKTKVRPSAKTAALLASLQSSADRTLYLNEYTKPTPPKTTASGKPEAPPPR